MLRRNPIPGLVLAALLPAQASAAEIRLELTPAEARYGAATALRGTVADDAGAPMGGTDVALVGRPFPYVGPFRTLATATTDDRGAYRLERGRANPGDVGRPLPLRELLPLHGRQRHGQAGRRVPEAVPLLVVPTAG